MQTNLQRQTSTGYNYRLVLKNESDFKKHCESLLLKYGKGNVPIEEFFSFQFEWCGEPT
jgi:hypothetical protein